MPNDAVMQVKLEIEWNQFLRELEQGLTKAARGRPLRIKALAGERLTEPEQNTYAGLSQSDLEKSRKTLTTAQNLLARVLDQAATEYQRQIARTRLGKLATASAHEVTMLAANAQGLPSNVHESYANVSRLMASRVQELSDKAGVALHRSTLREAARPTSGRVAESLDVATNRDRTRIQRSNALHDLRVQERRMQRAVETRGGGTLGSGQMQIARAELAGTQRAIAQAERSMRNPRLKAEQWYDPKRDRVVPSRTARGDRSRGMTEGEYAKSQGYVSVREHEQQQNAALRTRITEGSKHAASLVAEAQAAHKARIALAAKGREEAPRRIAAQQAARRGWTQPDEGASKFRAGQRERQEELAERASRDSENWLAMRERQARERMAAQQRQRAAQAEQKQARDQDQLANFRASRGVSGRLWAASGMGQGAGGTGAVGRAIFGGTASREQQKVMDQMILRIHSMGPAWRRAFGIAAIGAKITGSAIQGMWTAGRYGVNVFVSASRRGLSMVMNVASRLRRVVHGIFTMPMTAMRGLTHLRHAFWNLSFLAGMVGGAAYGAVKLLGPAAQMEMWRRQFALLHGRSMGLFGPRGMTAGAGRAEQQIGWLQKFEQKTPFNLPDVIGAARQMTVFKMFTPQRFAVIADAAAAFGVELNRVVRSLAYLRMGRWGQFLRSGTAMGISREKLRGEGVPISDRGVLETQDFESVLQAVLRIWKREVGGMGTAMGDAFQVAISNLKGAVFIMFADLFRNVTPVASQFVQSLQRGFRELGQFGTFLDVRKIANAATAAINTAFDFIMMPNKMDRMKNFINTEILGKDKQADLWSRAAIDSMGRLLANAPELMGGMWDKFMDVSDGFSERLKVIFEWAVGAFKDLGPQWRNSMMFGIAEIFESVHMKGPAEGIRQSIMLSTMRMNPDAANVGFRAAREALGNGYPVFNENAPMAGTDPTAQAAVHFKNIRLIRESGAPEREQRSLFDRAMHNDTMGMDRILQPLYSKEARALNQEERIKWLETVAGTMRFKASQMLYYEHASKGTAEWSKWSAPHLRPVPELPSGKRTGNPDRDRMQAIMDDIFAPIKAQVEQSRTWVDEQTTGFQAGMAQAGAGTVQRHWPAAFSLIRRNYWNRRMRNQSPEEAMIGAYGNYTSWSDSKGTRLRRWLTTHDAGANLIARNLANASGLAGTNERFAEASTALERRNVWGAYQQAQKATRWSQERGISLKERNRRKRIAFAWGAETKRRYGQAFQDVSQLGHQQGDPAGRMPQDRVSGNQFGITPDGQQNVEKLASIQETLRDVATSIKGLGATTNTIGVRTHQLLDTLVKELA